MTYIKVKELNIFTKACVHTITRILKERNSIFNYLIDNSFVEQRVYSLTTITEAYASMTLKFSI